MKLAELSKIITPDQDRKLVQVFEQHVRDMTAGPFANLSFVDWVERDVSPEIFGNAVMCPTPSGVIGIEPDGHAHS